MDSNLTAMTTSNGKTRNNEELPPAPNIKKQDN